MLKSCQEGSGCHGNPLKETLEGKQEQSDVCFATKEHPVMNFCNYEMLIPSSCESMKVFNSQ